MRLLFVLNLLLLLVSTSLHKVVAQVVAPSEGGYVKLEAATATTMQLSFGGKGQGRVVAIALSPQGYPVPLAAVDNTFYTANTTYSQGSPLGKGFAIYNGSGTTVVVQGLRPNTNYYITDAEYNTDGQGIAYNTQGTSIIATTRATDPMVAPLPVELVSFTGTVSAANLAALRWTTASEHNSSYFAIERSSNNQSFTEIGRVTAAGTSFQTLTYSWADPQPLTSTTYYRLRQVDLDATAQYSSVLALMPQKTFTQQTIEIYPNPSTSQTVQVALQGYGGETLNVRLFDNLGRVIYTNRISPASTVFLSPLLLPQSLEAGTYVLSFASATSHTQKRLIITE